MPRTSPVEHDRHDPALIAGHAAGDLTATDQLRAETLLSACTACTELHGDLVALQVATRQAPAPAMLARDLRLTPEQAERLRRGSRLRAFLRPFAAMHSATRPMAAALTSVGVAGLLIAAFVPGLLGSGVGSAPASGRDAATATSGAFEAAASQAPAGPVRDNAQGAGAGQPSGVAPAIEVEPTGPGDRDVLTGVTLGPFKSGGIHIEAGGQPKGSEDDRAPAALPSTPEGVIASIGPSTVVAIASLGFLLLGLALFGLRFAARRIR
jgi:anti-sigma factor RsiW